MTTSTKSIPPDLMSNARHIPFGVGAMVAVVLYTLVLVWLFSDVEALVSCNEEGSGSSVPGSACVVPTEGAEDVAQIAPVRLKTAPQVRLPNDGTQERPETGIVEPQKDQNSEIAEVPDMAASPTMVSSTQNSEANADEEKTPEVAYDGEENEGVLLAAFEVRERSDRAALTRWFASGLVVFELASDDGTFIVGAGPTGSSPFTNMSFERATRVADDMRSQLRIEYGTEPVPPRDLLEYQKVALGYGTGIGRVDAVFTHAALAQFMSVQELAKDRVSKEFPDLTPADLSLEVCFRGGQLHLATVTLENGRAVEFSSDCR